MDGHAITYDEIGNPLKYYNGKDWTFTWVNGRKLNSAVSGNTTVSYKYGADDLRMSKTVGGVTHEYLYLGDQLVEETWGSNSLKFAYDEQGRPYSVNYNGTTYYYILSQQGDVLYIVDEEGNIQTEYVYNAWGEILEVKGTAEIGSVNPLRYRGYYYDTETGFYYVSSRYYDPEVGRFISADGAISGVGGDIRGYNLYSYCFNNPVNMSDPDGNWPKWVSKIGNAVKNTVKTVVKAVKKAANTVKTTVAKFAKKTSGASNKRPPTGEPGSTYVAPNGDRRTYGPDGKPVHDYDHSDHGNPKNHPHDENGGHHHDWDWTKNPPRQGAYVPNVEMIVGVGLVTVSSIGIAAVALDDLTGIGIADNFLYGPLGAGVSQGLIMIY